ncbi:MAG: hypothetical protein IJW73_05115 [Candidatus Gastranaerophilales bacterium]|nr:hypothetical protein [Candidatus Gastranaerophilales bacterium]
MSKLSDFVEYKKHQPEYKEWKENRDDHLAKKVSYIKTNLIANDEFQKDVERAKIVLDAVNVMDEYSQTRAEDMEEVALSFETALAQIGVYGGGILAALTAALTCGKELLGNFNNKSESILKNKKLLLKLLPAGIVYGACIIATTIFSKFWSAKKQIEASRLGRTEAMTNDLASVNQFALLDENQKKEVEQIADGIQVDKKEAKKTVNANRGFGIISSLKTIFSPDADLMQKHTDFTKKINKEIADAENLQLNEQQIIEAKKDQELIQTVVEKIDIASQDYAENAELATNSITTIAMGIGGGTFVIANKILSKLKINNSKLISCIAGLGIMIAGAVTCAKIQKQASRVGRFKAKQELLNNPEQLVYVDEDKYQNNETKASKKERKNFFANIIQIFKDNKEYNEYINKNSVRDTQLRKAKDQVQLTKEQELRAKQLQNNVFKMFNKLDEKSQSYSEATEAIGDTVSELVSLVAMIPMMAVSGKIASKGGSLKFVDMLKMFASVGIALAMDIFVTKEQRNASRVANMEAIKEMDSYKYFASNEIKYEQNEQDKQKTLNSTEQNNKKTSPMLEKMLKK